MIAKKYIEHVETEHAVVYDVIECVRAWGNRLRYSWPAGRAVADSLERLMLHSVGCECLTVSSDPVIANWPHASRVKFINHYKRFAALEPKELEIKGAYDDPNGSHITIYCVSDKFEGKRSLARQQMVFKAIWNIMDGQGGTVHAVDTMTLKAPSEL